VADDLYGDTVGTTVSVIIPTRNRKHLLAETLRSVLGQRDVSVQAVVVDDASSDGTLRWLQGIPDPRVSVVAGAGRGPAAARNAGLDRAASAVVAFCDDDDLWAPDKLASQLAAMREQQAPWCTTGAVSVVGDRLAAAIPDRPPPSGDIRRSLLTRNRIPGGCSSVTVLRSHLEQAGGFDETLTTAADWDCWIRLATAPLATVDRPLVANRLGTGNMSSDVQRSEREVRQIIAKYAAAREALGVAPSWDDFLRHWAACALRAHDRKDAVRLHIRLGQRGASPYWRCAFLVAASLGWPGLQRRRDRRSQRKIPPAWQSDLRWLADYRRPPHLLKSLHQGPVTHSGAAALDPSRRNHCA
jgi:glycosyltransferase involved in cell wall biosynthesis